MAEAFDHDKHCRLLEEAEHELRMLGKDHLAGAVSRALMIHREFESRVAEARRVHRRLERAKQLIHQEQRTLEQYVCQARGPWIGPELFPEDPVDRPAAGAEG